MRATNLTGRASHLLFACFCLASLLSGCRALDAIEDNPYELNGVEHEGKSYVVSSLAGSQDTGYADGYGSSARFYDPEAITTDGTFLYISDTFNNRIRKVSIANGRVTTLAGSGASGSADGTGTAASFDFPYGIATDGTNLFVADWFNDKIRQIVIATGVVTTLAGSGTSGSVDGIGTAARFNCPAGLCIDGGYLYVVDRVNDKIRKIAIATKAVTTLAGSGASGHADGTGTAASFDDPWGIAVAGGYLYVTESDRIRRIAISTAAVTTFAGSGELGEADGIGTAASFHYPYGIATDGTNLYIADQGNNRIRKIVISSKAVTTIAGLISAYEYMDDTEGSGLDAIIAGPRGITSDGTSLYLTSGGFSCSWVREITRK